MKRLVILFLAGFLSCSAWALTGINTNYGAPLEDSIPNLYSVYLIERNEGDLLQQYEAVVILTDMFRWYYDERDSVYIDSKYRSYIHNRHNFHVLSKERRTYFMDSAHVKESDSIYITHPLTGYIGQYAVSDLDLVAFLNVYESDEVGKEVELNSYSYQLGLRLPEYPLDSSWIMNHTGIAAIQKHNPLAADPNFQLLHWQPLADFDTTVFTDEMINRWDYLDSTGASHVAYYGNLELQVIDRYYKQVRPNSIRYYMGCRFLVVRDTLTGEVVHQNAFCSSEGTYISPLRYYISEDESYSIQWVGNLLEGRAPVILNMVSFSFGCPMVTELDEAGRDLYIQCDNRH